MGRASRKEHSKLSGYLDALSRESPEEYRKAINEINTDIRKKRSRFFKYLDDLPARWATKLPYKFYGREENTNAPTTVTNRPIASVGFEHDPSLWREAAYTRNYGKTNAPISTLYDPRLWG